MVPQDPTMQMIEDCYPETTMDEHWHKVAPSSDRRSIRSGSRSTTGPKDSDPRESVRWAHTRLLFILDDDR
jgi:hypothetical protein